MEFINKKIENYVLEHSDAESDVIKKLNRETNAKVIRPRMLSGHLQGNILSMFSNMIEPKAVLEIGTFTGYSAICLAAGLQKNGIVHTIDINEELAPIVSRAVAEAGLNNKIKFHIGNALDIINTIEDTFDLVFIDADKHNYLNYFDLVIDKINVGAYIIADNVLWSGKVVDDIDPKDVDTNAIDLFNKTIQADDRVENTLMPVRDGLMIIRKVKD
jgi:predicted O-methyltransferase YrrM